MVAFHTFYNALTAPKAQVTAITAAETIERFKGRLPADAMLEIEALASNLIRLVSTL